MEGIVVIVLLILALAIVVLLLKYAFIGAVFLFAWASEQGFIGVAVYFACWIFLFPFMLVASIVTGFFTNTPD